MWELIKGVCGRNREPVSLLPFLKRNMGTRRTLVSSLNNHFASVGGPSDDGEPPIDIRAELPHPTCIGRLHSIGSIGISETQEAFGDTRANWQLGVVGVPSRSLQIIFESIAVPLTQVSNILLQSGRFSEKQQSAPLYQRKADRRQASCYRPISLIDYVSKVFERIVWSKMQRHLEWTGFTPLRSSASVRNDRRSSRSLDCDKT